MCFMYLKCGFESGVAMYKILHIKVNSELDIRIINSYVKERTRSARVKTLYSLNERAIKIYRCAAGARRER